MRGSSPEFFWLIVLAVSFAIAVLVARANSHRAEQERLTAAKLRAEANGLQSQISQLESRLSEGEFQVQGLTKILSEHKSQFPWLANAIADFHSFQAERDAQALMTKKHPAKKAADDVREHGKKRRDAERQFRIMRYRVDYYEKLFPWISDYVGDDVPDEAVDVSGSVSEADDDPAVQWLSKADYEKLPTIEKYQRALDNWRTSKKTRWKIGREYERYVGYVYETQGYDVIFTGAVDGFEDMGRDLIARRGETLLVIQCKYWSSAKVIREKHIFKLIGTSLEYAFRFRELKNASQLSLFESKSEESGITPILYTSTILSAEAKDAAQKLNVRFYENVQIAPHPMVKCNVALRDGEKIYHLPFDQQYDRVKIEAARGEKYVHTVAEAERSGFRRAWRWRPEKGD